MGAFERNLLGKKGGNEGGKEPRDRKGALEKGGCLSVRKVWGSWKLRAFEVLIKGEGAGKPKGFSWLGP